MKTINVNSLFSMVAGILYTFSGILFLVFQVNSFDWNSISSIMSYLDNTPHAMITWKLINWSAALASLFAIANIHACIAEYKRSDIVIWAGNLATFGYCIIALTNIVDLYHIQKLWNSFQVLRFSPTEMELFYSMVGGIGSLDPDLNLRFLTLGPWFLTIGRLGLDSRILPKRLAWLGQLMGEAALVMVIANLTGIAWALAVAAPIAVILHPIWLIWTGYLYQTKQ